MAAIVLAGGAAARLGGARKGLLRVGGRAVLARLLDTLAELFEERVIAVREAAPFLHYGLPLALDRLPGHCPLVGIHAGLSFIRADYGFVAPWDAPFLKADLVRTLLKHVDKSTDVVVPLKTDGYVEPLCAVYSKRCLAPIETQLAQGRRHVTRFYDKVNVARVPVSELLPADPDLESFLNLNTPDDVRAAVLKGWLTQD